VEHSLELEAGRPWRTLALVATGVAIAELLVIVGAFGARPLAHHLRRAAVEQASGPAPVAEPARRRPVLPRSQTSVLVLNGNGVAGAAASAADLVRAREYPIGGVGNARRRDYPRTLVMYRKGYGREARRLARDLNVSVVGPLDGMKPRELMGAQLALVVGG
jgi:hypothetical protein